MSKHPIYFALLILSLNVAAEEQQSHRNWNIGLIGGLGIGRTKETLNISSTIPSNRDYKFTTKRNGPIVGVFIGHTFYTGKNMYDLSFAGYKDYYKTINAGKKVDTTGSLSSYFTSTLERKNTWELSGKIGRLASANTYVYGKAGVLRSDFIEQYKDEPDISQQKRKPAWGGVLGFGVQKSYDTCNLGLEYNYQYYEKFGANMSYIYPGYVTTYNNRSKIRPQYHHILFSISKKI